MKPKFVDLFCGIGIGSLGFVRAGFEIAAAVDIDPDACAMYKQNLGVAPFVNDLRRVSASDILRRAGLRRGELPLCIGCPPCQGFSTLSRTRLKKGQRDNRKSLLKVFAQCVEELLPRVVVLENVRGLAVRRNRAFLHDLLAHLSHMNYLCEFDVLDAADYGVPQHRHRLVLIASRGKRPVLPRATHSDPRANNGKPSWKTVRDVIADLPALEAGERDGRVALHEAPAHSKSVLELIRRIPKDGGGRTSLPEGLWLPCHRRLQKGNEQGAVSVYGRMRWDAPSPTITTRCHTASCGRFIHPSQDRAITLREAARLQSIPDDYRVIGSKKQIGQWIGNAMPLNLAEALGCQAIQLQLTSQR